MAPSADDKRYATDTRRWSTGVLADGICSNWQESPVSDLLTMRDICYYKPGDLNKNGKEGRTSWDSFSYCLLMSHNVWMHITAVQEANRRFDSGSRPRMMEYRSATAEKFEDIVDAIFSAPTRQASEDMIKYYHNYWMQIRGTRGFAGKAALNSRAQADVHLDIEGDIVTEKPKKVKLQPDTTLFSF
jgi:hypothetical protein